MTQFRESRALKNAGLSGHIQGLIYYRLINIDFEPAAFKEHIIKLCEEIAQEDAAALYEFLTNSRIDHNYIYMHYFVPIKRLYKLKRILFVRIANEMGIKANINFRHAV